jgi:hypothetical protein
MSVRMFFKYAQHIAVSSSITGSCCILCPALFPLGFSETYDVSVPHKYQGWRQTLGHDGIRRLLTTVHLSFVVFQGFRETDVSFHRTDGVHNIIIIIIIRVRDPWR